MEIRFFFVASLIAITLHLTGGIPAYAQSNVESLRELLRQQSTERIEKGRLADVEALISEETKREVLRARQSGKGGNIQIRRGDTNGVDQEQLGEGNLQSISVGSGN